MSSRGATDVDLTDPLYFMATTALLGLIGGAGAVGWWLYGWPGAIAAALAVLVVLTICAHRGDARERAVQQAYERGYQVGRRDGYQAGYSANAAPAAAPEEEVAEVELARPGVRSRTSLLAG